MCIVGVEEGMLRGGLFRIEVKVCGARGIGVMLMCQLCGVGGVGGGEVGVGGAKWVLCWVCCVVWGWGVILLLEDFRSVGWEC